MMVNRGDYVLVRPIHHTSTAIVALPTGCPFGGSSIVEPAKDSLLLKSGNLKVNMLQLVEHGFG